MLASTVDIALVTEAERAELWEHLQAYLREQQAASPGREIPYPYFEPYWREPNERWPFWGMGDGQRIGFALVRWDGERFEMSEFYVLPAFRQMGFGSALAGEVIGRFAGDWEVSASARNAPGMAFWRRVLAAFDAKEGPVPGLPRVRWRFAVA